MTREQLVRLAEQLEEAKDDYYWSYLGFSKEEAEVLIALVDDAGAMARR